VSHYRKLVGGATAILRRTGDKSLVAGNGAFRARSLTGWQHARIDPRLVGRVKGRSPQPDIVAASQRVMRFALTEAMPPGYVLLRQLDG
jgi:hypothetical protein